MGDLTILKIILSLAGSLILLLLGVIGYFLKQQIGASNALTEAVNLLNANVMVLQSQQDDSHPRIERRLNNHADRLDNQDKRIVRVETKLNIN